MAKDSPESLQMQPNAGGKGTRDETEIAKGKLTDQKFDISMRVPRARSLLRLTLLYV